MFSKPYPVHYCGIDRNKVHPNHIETHLFRFKDSSNHAYIIRAEKFPNNAFVINFYLKAHRLSTNRYSLNTSFFHAIPIFATCLSVMVTLYRKNPFASFVVIGANSAKEQRDNTKRFRVYRTLLGRFFRPATFQHREFPGISTYILVNRNRLSIDPILLQKIIVSMQ